VLVATPEATLLVDEAKLVLGRLSGSAPDIAVVVKRALDWIDSGWSTPSLVVGIAGDVVARSAVIDHLCGGDRIIDGASRGGVRIGVRISRSAGTQMTYRAVLADDRKEDAAMPDGKPDPARRDELLASAEAARSELAAREAAAAAAARGVPALVKVRPRPWTFWLWPIRWIARLFSRKSIAVQSRADAAVAEARGRVASLDHEIRGLEADAARARTEFVDRLRELCSGERSGAGVREIMLRVGAPLPLGVEAIELTGYDTPEIFDGFVKASRPTGDRPPDGNGKITALPAFFSAMPSLLGDARAVRLGRAAREAVEYAVESIATQLAAKTADLETRIHRLEALRIADPATFGAMHVNRIRPQIIASVHAVMEHASTHLGSELAQLADAWSQSIHGATSSDELKAAVAKIDEGSPAELQRIAEEVRLLVMGGVGGSAHDLIPELLSGLDAHQLSDEKPARKKAAPAIAPVAILPSLANPTAGSKIGGAGWLTGLFRSLDAKRADLLARAQQRADHVRDVATSELLDAEPQLNAALQGALSVELTAAIDRQVAWLDERLTRERAVVEKERVALAPLDRALERARRDARRLTDMLEPLEKRLRVGFRHATGGTAIDIALVIPEMKTVTTS
jgi:hypothetical protein